MTFGTMELIQTVTVPAGGQAAIEFTNIPATYDDLVIKTSLRNSGANGYDNVQVSFNGTPSGSSYSARNLTDYVTAVISQTSSSASSFLYLYSAGANATASTFANSELYITNYRSSNNKSISADSATESNSGSAFTSTRALAAGLWAQSSAITSVTLTPPTGTFVQHSTATLYGITRVPAGAKATGGVIYDDANFFYHVFTSSGTFTPSQNITADCLVIAGGGGGSLGNQAGGGGAGGLLAHSAQSLISATSYTVTVGGGGAGGTSGTPIGSQGSNSVFGSLTASVGGGFGGRDVFGTIGGGNGGSGGGGGTNAYGGTATGGTATSGQGNNGGTGANCGAGGGGAGAVGANGGSTSGGAGGAGSSTYSSWGVATSSGQDVSGTRFYAGGGSGGSTTGAAVAGGNGGGGAGGTTNNDVGAVSGTANTGGGGGGGSSANNTAARNGGSGGSGIVIVRYAK